MSLLRNCLGLSRVPHSLLDVALPAFCALAWLGGIPSMRVTFLSLLTATCAYLAIYALNDLVDMLRDREKELVMPKANHEGYIDALLTIHPLAKGQLSFKAACSWVFGLLLIAVTGAYLLNPITLWILAAGGVCEVAYCSLFKKSPLRVVLSGVVKACGPMAAVFVVDNDPNPALLLILFVSIFLWEIGGQNLPADWVDIEQDKAVYAKTMPIQYGLESTRILILISLTLSIFANLWFLANTPNAFNPLWLSMTLLLSGWLLMVPAIRLFQEKSAGSAKNLFNRASTYPIWLLILTGLHIYMH